MWWFSRRFFSCLPFNSRWQCNVWYFDILQRIFFFSFRSLKIQFLSIFRLIRRHGVWKHERSQSKSMSMKLMSMKKELLKCWWTTTLLPSYRVSKIFLALYISFFLTLEAIAKYFPFPLGNQKCPKTIIQEKNNLGKNSECRRPEISQCKMCGLKWLDHNICFQPRISPERYETLVSSLISMICPKTSYSGKLFAKQYCCSWYCFERNGVQFNSFLVIYYSMWADLVHWETVY